MKNKKYLLSAIILIILVAPLLAILYIKAKKDSKLRPNVIMSNDPKIVNKKIKEALKLISQAGKLNKRSIETLNPKLKAKINELYYQLHITEQVRKELLKESNNTYTITSPMTTPGDQRLVQLGITDLEIINIELIVEDIHESLQECLELIKKQRYKLFVNKQLKKEFELKVQKIMWLKKSLPENLKIAKLIKQRLSDWPNQAQVTEMIENVSKPLSKIKDALKPPTTVFTLEKIKTRYTLHLAKGMKQFLAKGLKKQLLNELCKFIDNHQKAGKAADQAFRQNVQRSLKVLLKATKEKSEKKKIVKKIRKALAFAPHIAVTKSGNIKKITNEERAKYKLLQEIEDQEERLDRLEKRFKKH